MKNKDPNLEIGHSVLQVEVIDPRTTFRQRSFS